MRDTQRAWAEIDLDAIKHNLTEVKKQLHDGVKMMAVVKADAYGHGAVEVSKTALESGADWLGVALFDEAVQLRNSQIDAPILILGKISAEYIRELFEYNITPCVADIEFARLLSKEAVKCCQTIKVHLKIDTGMSRIGFLYDDNSENRQRTEMEILEISKLPGIEIEGAFTHFSLADSSDTQYTRMQYSRFCDIINYLKEKGIEISLKHVSNSAATLNFPEMQMDMVRVGIISYGLKPSDETAFGKIDFIPAMTFKTRIVHIKEVDENTRISYGGIYRADEKKVIATLGVGYADGYSRILSDKAEVVVKGKKLKQIGRICMDQCMIDVTEVNNINVGDEVILFGGGKTAEVSADDVAEKLGTINYEVVCKVGKRVPRVYIKSGKQVGSSNSLL